MTYFTNVYAGDTRETSTVWVCVDCYFATNGLPLDDNMPDETPLNRLDGEDFTPGLMRSEHDSECDPDRECECEQRAFTWSQCDGCGSMLGGARQALTVWTVAVVFGPDRPNAARHAVEAVRAARERLNASHPHAAAYDGLLARLRAAEVVRAQYYEYGDSLFG